MLFSSDFGITPFVLGGFDSLENWGGHIINVRKQNLEFRKDA